MREIGKYRGKRKDNGEWDYGCLFKTDGRSFVLGKNCRIIQSGGHDAYINHFTEVIPETVGEFTDLHDIKNKHDLYGGDRVVIGSDRGILVWDEYELCWSLQLDNNEGDLQALCRFYTCEDMDNIEYIGNIHEEQNG